MKPLISACAACCLLFLGEASAEVQTQHAFDTSVTLKNPRCCGISACGQSLKAEVLSQIRTGPIFEFNLNDRVTLIAGSYFTREQEEHRWAVINRPFAGGEFMLWGRGVEVDWRSLLERFVITHEPDYFEFRNRFRVSPRGRTAPYAAVEVSTDANGLRSVKYSAGFRRTLTENFMVDIGYFFEDRRPMPSGERHMFSTSFHWRNKTRRIDPDF